MPIDRKTLENEKRYVHKLLSYMYKDVEIQLNEVILDKSDIHVVLKDKMIISLLEENEYAYVSIKDKNINIQSEKKYHINFEGELQGNPNVELHIEMYDYEGKKLEKSHVAQINQAVEIKFAADTQYIKFLVRIAGSGILSNAKIKVQALGEWVKPKQDQYLISDREDYIDIDVEEYNTYTVHSMTQMAPDIFYTECKSIQIGSSIEIDCNESGQYISLYEKNVNFNILPNVYPINIDAEHNYYINFKGQVDIGLKAQLFVIIYSQSAKEEVYQIALNQSNTISPSRGSKYMRLALRVEGKGSLEITSIEITSKKKIGFIGYKNLKKLGFDMPKQLSDIRMACIFDEFTTECYKYSCQLMPITPDDWKAQFTIRKPHILMVESAWVGNKGAWSRKVAYTSENNIKELRELIEWCKENQIPTVFWNKEDPVHYDVFINTAKMFDYIFTTDENKVNDYKKDAGNENVYALPFAAQPSIHNPIKISKERNSKACFAGSYYAAKYPERQEDINRLLDAAVETIGIEIYDRKFGTDDKDFLFPKRFRSYIQGRLEPHELHIANKGYKVMVNVNSVKESPTMFSRRVFEGLACGTPVISSYAEGINNIFEGLVVASDDYEVLASELNKLNQDKEYYATKSLEGIRTVLSKHTYNNRLGFILDKLGVKINEQLPLINMLYEADTIQQIEEAKSKFNAQVYKNKMLTLLIPNSLEFVEAVNESRQEPINYIVKEYYKESKKTLDKIVVGDYIAYFNHECCYGKYYLLDLALAGLYCNGQLVGKSAYYDLEKRAFNNESSQYTYTHEMLLDRCIIAHEVYKEMTLTEFMKRLNDTNIDLFSRGYRMFSADKFNFSINSQYIGGDI